MRIKNLNNSAFSLLEILLAAIIFIVTVAGAFVTLNAVRAPVTAKENALSATVFGQQVLEALYSQVSAVPYYSNCSSIVNGNCRDFSLYLGPHLVPQGLWPASLVMPSTITQANTVGGNTYLNYNVSCADGSLPVNVPPPDCPNKPRQVTLNISW